MKYCVACKKELPDVARFCSSCRAEQPIHFAIVPPRRQTHVLGWVVSVVLILAILVVGAWKLNLFRNIHEPLDDTKADIRKDSRSQKSDDAKDDGFLNDASGHPAAADAFGTPDDAQGQEMPTAENPYIDPTIDQAALEEDLIAIEDAFQTADSKAIELLIYPQMRTVLMDTFATQPDRLQEVSVLLKTRKPVILTDLYAEYQVEDNGKAYTVIFQKYDDHWLLTGL